MLYIYKTHNDKYNGIFMIYTNIYRIIYIMTHMMIYLNICIYLITYKHFFGIYLQKMVHMTIRQK